MLRAVFGPMRQQRRGSEPLPKPAGWFQDQVAPLLSSVSRQACTHPIQTLVVIAIMASTTYISLLQSSLFDSLPSQTSPAGHVEFSNLLVGSKTLHTSKNTNWRWQNGESTSVAQTAADLALLTFVFPDSASDGSTTPAPQPASIPQMNNSSIKVLPSSKNFLSPISQETTLAVSVPFNIAPDFLNSLRELPLSSKSRGGNYQRDEPASSTNREEKRWMMSAAKGDANGGQKSFKGRVADAWTAFVDLLKNAEELDIIIMVLGYLSMHLTFVSLFLSLRRLGSNFWLGATTLFSSIFAFLFGLMVTTRFNVPINMVLLSEGLPFLVVTIGFEKPIILTKAVLQAALALKKSSRTSDSSVRHGKQEKNASPDIRTAIQIGVQDCGYDIVRDYAIEILILVAGAASGVQGGLCQFCFLAAWILFFDCILLFTFYTAILTIKLEINRIRRHVTLRRVLEEDGVSRKVAEEVASNDEWPKIESSGEGNAAGQREHTFLGFQAKDSSVSKFKVLMVTGFIAINLVNFCTAPFRTGGRSTGSALSSVVTQPLMDPFKVAGSGLDTLLNSAKARNHATSVTVLTPIKYELEYPSVHYASGPVDDSSIFDMGFADQFMDGVGGRVVEGVLKSFEDPVLGKWIIVALAMSLVLNGYLFNAARWSIKEPPQLPKAEQLEQEAATTNRPRSSHKPSSDAPVTNLRTPPERIAEPQKPALSVNTSPVSPSYDGRLRSRSDCEALLKDKRAAELNDEELIDLTVRGKIPGYALEKTLGDKTRAVKVRRGLIARTPATTEITHSLEASKLPFENYDYDLVHGACCENVIGYLPLPLGVAGPMVIDGASYYLPMATTEGVLVASTSRGAKAINAGGGATTVLTGDGMTRGPCVSFSSLSRAGEAKIWLDSDAGQTVIRNAFNSTSRFARLQTLKSSLAGTYLYIRFKTTTGDAMGMNMISKGVEHALHVMSTEAGFDDMQIISVSGNFCTDKKPAAINWVDGRGKSVVAEAIVPGEVVRSVLKSDVDAMVELNVAKNLIGSAMAGSIGGQNAHAANIVTALFLATGQDPAQNVESSNCITVMKKVNGNLQISVSMPCIEVGTIGGGTFLGPQAAMLDLLGVRGAHATSPGSNSRQLARIIGAAVLAGELSLCAALAAGHLVRAHMQHNRSQTASRATTPAPTGRVPLQKTQSSASLITSVGTNITGARDR